MKSLFRRVRLSLGQSQDKFARLIGVSKGAVQNWEAGINESYASNLQRMIELAPKFARELRGVMEHPKERVRTVRKSERMQSSPGFISIKTAGRRFDDHTISSAHQALDLVLDHAHEEIIKKIQALLDKHAEQWRERSGDDD